MEKVPFLQILDYKEAFHDELFKKQFSLVKGSRIHPLSYFSTLPSGDLVSDADFDMFLSDQMFQEEFEFTVADDMSVAFTNNFRLSPSQNPATRFNFSKSKSIEVNFQSKLRKLNTFHLGEKPGDSSGNVKLLEMPDPFEIPQESGLASRTSISGQDINKNGFSSLRMIHDGQCTPDHHENGRESPSSPATLRKYAANDHQDGSSSPLNERRSKLESSVLKMCQQSNKFLIIEENVDAESANMSSNYQQSSSNNSSAQHPKRTDTIEDPKKNTCYETTEIKEVLQIDIELENKTKNSNLSQQEYHISSLNNISAYENLTHNSKAVSETSIVRGDLSQDEIVEQLTVDIILPVNHKIISEINYPVKQNQFKSPDNTDFNSNSRNPKDDQDAGIKKSSSKLNLSEVFNNDEGYTNSNFHQRFSQTYTTPKAGKILNMEDIDRKIRAARLKNMMLDKERSSAGEISIQRDSRGLMLWNQGNTDSPESEFTMAAQIAEEYQKPAYSTPKNTQTITLVPQGSEKHFYMKSSAGQALLAKKLKENFKNRALIKSNASTIKFSQEDHWDISKSMFPITSETHDKTVEIKLSHIPFPSSVYESENLSKNHTKRVSSEDPTQELDSPIIHIETKLIKNGHRQIKKNPKNQKKIGEIMPFQQMQPSKHKIPDSLKDIQSKIKQQCELKNHKANMSIYSEDIKDDAYFTPRTEKDFRKPSMTRKVWTQAHVKEHSRSRGSQQVKMPLFSLYGRNQNKNQLDPQPRVSIFSNKVLEAKERRSQKSRNMEECPLSNEGVFKGSYKHSYRNIPFGSNFEHLDISPTSSSLQKTLKFLKVYNLHPQDSPPQRQSQRSNKGFPVDNTSSSSEAQLKINRAVAYAKEKLIGVKSSKVAQNLKKASKNI